ncbi:MAG: ACP S-malonyltransferase [Oculatellaceae cyanobacterium Prado106]|jgi:hypothetical protein|nr:ACP S-malonyltransferase [Oculatellaceae cyanobacterium Prado106]
MNFLVDHNLEGHAIFLFGQMSNLGWLELLQIRFITFEEVSLSVASNDRVVWRFAQENQMILMTANRSMKGKDSLERVMREENTLASLPVVTIGDADRVLGDLDYRNRCVDRLIDIVFDMDDCRGTGRLFIP